MSDSRWSIWIDIEGFSTLYNKNVPKAITALSKLTEAVYLVGSKLFSNYPMRLFIHQFGDGFVIVSDLDESSPKRPIAISIAIMRHLLKQGIITKSAISSGDFSDIRSCYPDSVMKNVTDNGYIKLGEGIMTITTVMGTSFIASHKLANKMHGALLLIDTTKFAQLPEYQLTGAPELSSIDWLHDEERLVKIISNKCGLSYVEASDANKLMNEYICKHKTNLPEDWHESTKSLLNIEN